MDFSPADAQPLMWITARPDLVFVEGRGSWLTDHRGKRYLDFVQGWAVNCLGHGHPAIVDALAAQAGKLINPSPAFYNEPSLKLARGLTEHSCFDRVFFASTGAEANEGAIKLARKWGKVHKGGAFEIVTFTGSFHGRTLATMSASGKPGWDTLFAPPGARFPQGYPQRPGLGRSPDRPQHRGGDAGAGPGRRRRGARHHRIPPGPAPPH